MIKDDHKSELISYIISYLEILNKCLSETTYTSDRALFKNSIVIVSKWLVELKYKSSHEVIEIILDSHTDKIILDAWKNGKWGEDEAKGLKNLQQELKKIL